MPVFTGPASTDAGPVSFRGSLERRLPPGENRLQDGAHLPQKPRPSEALRLGVQRRRFEVHRGAALDGRGQPRGRLWA